VCHGDGRGCGGKVPHKVFEISLVNVFPFSRFDELRVREEDEKELRVK
jgi:hypothetical protein